jgi:hypothetical protein
VIGETVNLAAKLESTTRRKTPPPAQRQPDRPGETPDPSLTASGFEIRSARSV